MDTFKKRTVLGTFADTRKIGKYHSRRTVSVDIEIRAKEQGPELSICGDVGFPGARDVECCGQIDSEVRAFLDEPGATFNKSAADIRRLLEVWEKWHLNSMRTGCEHQRAAWKADAEIPLVTYKLTSAVLVEASGIRRTAEKRLAKGETVTYGPGELRLMNLPYQVTLGAEFSAPGPEYAEEKREVKRANWVYPSEHPAGVLCKPCEVCGYKFGTVWLYEPLPADVVQFLRNF